MNTSGTKSGPSPPPTLVKWFTEEEVRRMLTWDVLMPAVWRALAAFSRGPDHPEGAVQPLRASIPINNHNGMMRVMSGYLPGEEALATKIISLFPDNKKLGLPSHNALIALLNPITGALAAILPGVAITELRTAAASAVATQELLSNGAGTMRGKGIIVAVLGAGTQGRAHARVMAHVFKPIKIRIWSRRVDAAKALADLLRSEGIETEVSLTVQEAVRNADVINTCTLATSPILMADWVKPGSHINSVGAPRPEWQEIEEELVRKATVYADSREAALAEAGDIIKSGGEVFAEIGEVLRGTKPAHRDNTTIFKSLGLAVEDAVSARLVYDVAMTQEGHIKNSSSKI